MYSQFVQGRALIYTCTCNHTVFQYLSKLGIMLVIVLYGYTGTLVLCSDLLLRSIKIAATPARVAGRNTDVYK